ncbi:DUF6968 family protein [Rhodoplanes azumiensis]|uniref:DUF6968 family protein n=1 Tax=Rhodoplanes azumiensis TaxID=1897628 RepID=A0ABW5AFY6_9BRAD
MIMVDRNLSYRAEGGETVRMQIRIHAPATIDGHWVCVYEIDWPDGTRRMEAAGVDSMQALVVALQMIGAELYTSSYHAEGRLVFDAPGSGYGFPVVPSLRPLLVGDDARFF